MKVVEVRNLYASYSMDRTSSKSDLPEEAHWATMYVMKQMIRLIEIKNLKNKINAVELYTPETMEQLIRSLNKKNN
jgi:hypothetical protein